MRETLKRLYLIQELDLAVNVIKSGLAILQQSRLYKTQHFLFLLTLSTGIERLMKLLLSLHHFDSTGQFLAPRNLKRYGHNVARLKNDVCKICFSKMSSYPPMIEQDRSFLEEDPLLVAILDTLSDFGERDRYLFMDGINDPDSTGEWIDRRWERIESMTFPEEEGLTLVTNGRLDEYKSRATATIIICLERFLRALARTVTHAGLNGEAKSLGTGVWDFLTIRDDHLGKTKYEVVNI